MSSQPTNLTPISRPGYLAFDPMVNRLSIADLARICQTAVEALPPELAQKLKRSYSTLTVGGKRPLTIVCKNPACGQSKAFVLTRVHQFRMEFSLRSLVPESMEPVTDTPLMDAFRMHCAECGYTVPRRYLRALIYLLSVPLPLSTAPADTTYADSESDKPLGYNLGSRILLTPPATVLAQAAIAEE